MAALRPTEFLRGPILPPIPHPSSPTPGPRTAHSCLCNPSGAGKNERRSGIPRRNLQLPVMRFLPLLVIWLLGCLPAYAGDASLAAQIETLKRQVAEQARQLDELSRRLAAAEARNAAASEEQ